MTTPVDKGTNRAHSLILLVEDDTNDALLAQMALQKAGSTARLVHLGDGEQAIQYLSGLPPYDDRVAHPLPGLILLDLKMPRLSGFDVLNWLQTQPELAKKCPVVVLTGSILEQDAKDARKLGAVGFEMKPVDFEDMVRVVGSVHNEWLIQGR
jgi:CheY-like chemotaxis protein